jgi:hypothetical protein
MKMTSIALAALSMIATVSVAQAQAVLRSVGVYDAPTHANVVDLNNWGGVTYPVFTGGLPAAWAANSGGVANFDQPELLAPGYPAMGMLNARVFYGVGGVNTLGMLFSGPANISAPVGGAVPISWNGVLQVPAQPVGVPFTIKLQPSTLRPLMRVGLTILQQQTQQTIGVTWIQSGGPNLTGTVTPAVGAIPTRDICFLRQATVPGGIVAVQIMVTRAGTATPISFNIDDFGFQH